MGIWSSYRLRLRRRRYQIRARFKHRELTSVANRTKSIRPDDVLLFSTFRNEGHRLEHFFDYYRALGINHFLMVDNDSDDGGAEFVAQQPDASLWHTAASYRSARYGVDWLNHLQRRFAHGHWTLTVDPDELFVFAYCDSRPIGALTDWLDETGVRSFPAMLLDLYPKGPLSAQSFSPGQDPLDVTQWFDSGNYTIQRNEFYNNLWIQGGPRARTFFQDRPERAPALNKIPLVKWHRRYAYISSTHTLLPRGLNQVYEEWGGEKASGVLLHTKFLPSFAGKAQEELTRGQHYAGSHEYRAYASQTDPDLWCRWSEKYIGWRQLEILGLMSKGNWA